jgi:CelD/BcsL family acetyltransferase involved in cellulose biosynthesis
VNLQVGIENHFDFLSSEYEDLFSRSVASAFQHPIWLNSLYRTLAPKLNAEPLIIVVRSEDDGRIMLLLPLVRRRYRKLLNVIEFAGLKVCDYAAPVCDRECFDQILQDSNVCARIQDLLRPFDLLRIKNVKEGSPPLERLLGVPLASMGNCAHASPLATPFSEWRISRLTRSYLKELDKKERQLCRKGTVRFECVADEEAIAATLRSMQIFRGPRFEKSGGDLLQDAAYFDFYSEVAIVGRENFSRVYALTMDGETIAGVLGLADRNSLLIILSGFDHARFKNQSIGALTFLKVAEDAIARGDAELDFTIGDEPYKQLFGAIPTPMWMMAKAGSLSGTLANLALAQIPWIKALAQLAIGTDA